MILTLIISHLSVQLELTGLSNREEYYVPYENLLYTDSPKLRSSYVPEGPAQVEFFANRK
jgi:hypothetical protein